MASRDQTLSPAVLRFPRIRRWSRLCSGSQWAGEVVDLGAQGVEFRLLINRHVVVSQRFETRQEALTESARMCELCTTSRDAETFPGGDGDPD